MKSQIHPFFYNSRAGLCRTKSTSLPDILVTRMRSFRPEWGGGGGGDATQSRRQEFIVKAIIIPSYIKKLFVDNVIIYMAL